MRTIGRSTFERSDMRIRIDKTVCCGNLECVRIAPALFREGEDGFGVVRLDTLPPELETAALEASQSCPANAVVLMSD